jgi:hypothetical protein
LLWSALSVSHPGHTTRCIRAFRIMSNRWRGIGTHHLGSGTHLSSAHSHDHSGGRTIGGPHGMDCFP